VLYLKRARYDENLATADADARRGEDALRDLIAERGDIDAYPYAALVAHKYRYLAAHGSANLHQEMEALVNVAEIGIRKHPMDAAMQEAHHEILRAYLMLAVKEPTGNQQESIPEEADD
jgi:hypothetical protein